MKRVGSHDTARVRRELAQLLRRLRAVRRMKLSHNELTRQVKVALDEAAVLFELVSLEPNAPAGYGRTEESMSPAVLRKGPVASP